MTTASLADLQSSPNESCTSRHASSGGADAAAPHSCVTCAFIGRVSNAVSLVGAHIRNGDHTHRTSFAAPNGAATVKLAQS